MVAETFMMDGKNVLRKIGLLIGVAACGALVTSCGGDDTPTPTPTESGTATPTPTPSSSTVNFDFAQAFDAFSANASAIYAYFTPTGGTETFNAAARVNGQSQIQYAVSPGSVSVTYPELDTPVTFDDAALVSSSATQRTYEAGDEMLVLELPFQHVLRATYELDNQAFTQDSVVGTLRSRRVTAFFNAVTTTDDFTTDLNYNGSVDVVGGDPGTTLPGAISAADITFTINEADDSVSATINIFEDIAGTPTLVATLVFERTTDGSGNVTGGVLNANGTFSGVLTDDTNNLVGNFAGALSGPNREEIFVVFSVSGDTSVDADDDRRFIGSFIGAR